jgi:hypothetical protein
MTSNGRWPQNIKSQIFQQPPIGSYSILNLSLDEQTILFKFIKWRRPLMEDDHKILKLRFLSNHSNFKLKFIWPNHILQILKVKSTYNGNDLKIFKGEYWSTYWIILLNGGAKMTSKCLECDLWVLRGKLEENSEEISSVALLSPACNII